MKKLLLAIFLCGSMVLLVSCSDDDDLSESQHEYTGIPLIILDTDIGSSTSPTGNIRYQLLQDDEWYASILERIRTFNKIR
jgi:hypothetical protein